MSTFCPKSESQCQWGDGEVKEIKYNQDVEYSDLETGEVQYIPAGSKLLLPERVEQMAEYARLNNQSFEEKNDEFQDTLRMRGRFFSVLCPKTEILWGKLSEPTIGKLIFLATYIDKNNCICFDGGWEREKVISYRNSMPMSKNDIRELLNVSQPTFRQFWNECMENKAIIESDGAYYLPRKMVRFCDNSKVNTKKVRMIKVFKHAVRYMYENTDERSKKLLTHLYRLIPFINLKYNILCENPFEMERENVRPLTAADICEKVGIDRTQHERVVKALKKLSFVDRQGNLRSVITYRWDMKNKEDRYWISINPQFYSGYISENDMVEMLDDFMYNENELEMYEFFS